MFNTPASWTDYYPVEIFVKGKQNYTKWNQCVTAGYKYSLYEKQNLCSKIEAMQNEIWRLQYAEAELEKCRKENEKLKEDKEAKEDEEPEEKREESVWKSVWKRIGGK